MREMHARACLVEGVDGLVGEGAVGDVALCQFDTRVDGLVGVLHVVVVLVAVLDVMEYLQGLVLCGRLDEYLLEAALQGSVFLDAVAVLVKGGGTYALYGAACQRGFHDVGGIHRACCRACTDEGVDLVDEENDVGVALYLLQ